VRSAGSFASGLAGRLAQLGDRFRRGTTRALALTGLEKPVEVRWDEAGTPHVFAENRRDLFRAQGYVIGKARAFQMEFNRRAASGRLAEMLGRHPVGWRELTVHLRDRSTPDADLLLRTMGLRRAAEASLKLHSAPSLEALNCYAAGASQAFAAHTPLEARLLKTTIAPWTPVDSLTLVRGMAFELSFSWRSVLLYDAIAHRLHDDPVRMRALFPAWPADDRPPTTWDALRSISADTIATEEAMRELTAMGGAHAGSNAWAVAGSRSASGKPIVCSDPHLMLQAPTPHFAIHLSCPDFEVAGSAIPGIPGVVFGHNRHVAWGITASCASDADAFVEEVDFGKKVYRTEEGWAPLESRLERIEIMGEKHPWEVEVFSTRHGPLIHHATQALAGQKATRGFAHALRWIGQDPAADLDALLGINEAIDWVSFRNALAKLHAPQLNFVYGDTAGHIGWQLTGSFPVRKDGSDGLRPTDGKTDAAGWSRYLTLDELPHVFDPPSGFVVSANTKPIDQAYPFPLGHTFEPPFRYDRISALIEAHPKHDVASMRAIQNDAHSLWAERVHARIVRPALLAMTARGRTEALRKRLADWDGVPRATSVEAALFYALHDHLVHGLVDDTLGDTLAIAYLELLNVAVLPIERLLEADDPIILHGKNVQDRVEKALIAAEKQLEEKLGSNVEAWTWGRLHVLWHRHRMHDVPALGKVVSIGPFYRPGDGFSVNNAHWFHSRPHNVLLGPGVRLIMDTGGWERTRVVLSTGSSGDPLSPRYRDHAVVWAEGRDFSLGFGAGAATDGVVERYVTTSPS